MSGAYQTIDGLIAAFTAAGTIAFGAFILLWVLERLGLKIQAFQNIAETLREKALLYSFLISLAGVLGSLFYSNVLGYEPCALCWWARVFLYPQAFVLAFAWPKKDTSVFNYLLPMSFIGAILMIYNHAMQVGVTSGSSLICGVGESADCSVRFVFEYGFVTIPWMALLAFAGLIILGLLGKGEGQPLEASVRKDNLHEVAITAIVVKNGKYLITRRSKNEDIFPGRWTVPGGKVEKDDYLSLPKDTKHHWYNVLERTLRHEVKQETNIDIKNIEYVTSLAMLTKKAPLLVISCLADYAGGEIQLQEEEADAYAWVTLEEAKDYDLIEGIYDELIMAEQQLKGVKGEWERKS